MAATAQSREEWNHPRCWSPPSRYRSAGQGSPGSWPSTAAWLEPDSNHTSMMSISLRNFVLPHFAHFVPAGRISSAGCLYQASAPSRANRLDDELVDRWIVQELVAAFALEHRDGHAPDALARDAPVGTRGDHVGDALFAPRRIPLDLADLFQRAAAQRSAVGSLPSIEMNHCSVARKMIGLWQRQQCGYECSIFS